MLSRTLKAFFLALIAVALLAFSIVNRQVVSLSLFPFPYAVDMPLFIFALLCFALGVIALGVVTAFLLLRSKCLLKYEKRRIQALENEIKLLRLERDSFLTAFLKPTIIS